jgi:2-alkenal reductase
MFTRSSLTKFTLVVVIALVFVSSFAVVTSIASPSDAPTTTLMTEEDALFANIYQQVSPSVVAINVLTRQGGGSGSGFVIDTAGHIVTNNHVVDNATSIEVEFFDGTLARANIVGVDPDSDIAVIQVDLPAEELTPVEFGNSDDLLIGQTVLAIGSPYGQRWTLTSGIVSGLDRVIQSLAEFSIGGVIQTDAAINPGNSGGPLLDLEGRVIGVNSQISSRSGSNSGVGFAVPGNLTKRVAQQLIDNGDVEYSFIGVSGGDVTLSLIEALGLPNNVRGVVVGDATASGPAELAGLQDASDVVQTNNGLTIPRQVDIITAINGTRLTGIADLITYLANNTTPGDTVTLSVLRNGTQQLEIGVHLTARPN